MIRMPTISIIALACIIALALSEPQRGQQQDRQGRASRCNPDVCRLPDCFCGGKNIPGGYKKEQIPQFVLLTFDDAINGINKEFFSKLFNERYNPNGCPIKVSTLLDIIFNRIYSNVYTISTCYRPYTSKSYHSSQPSIFRTNGPTTPRSKTCMLLVMKWPHIQ